MTDQYENYYDFDAEWSANASKKLPVKIKGRMYTLAEEIPAKAILVAVKLQKQGINALPVEDVLEVIGMLVGGSANAEQMMADGIALHQLMDVMRKCMSLIQNGLPEELQGEATAPGPAGASTLSTAS
jgi:hypothetical protein